MLKIFHFCHFVKSFVSLERYLSPIAGAPSYIPRNNRNSGGKIG